MPVVGFLFGLRLGEFLWEDLMEGRSLSFLAWMGSRLDRVCSIRKIFLAVVTSFIPG